MHLLDRPVWNALCSGWSDRAEGDERAKRIDPLYGPFGAAADDSEAARHALAVLVPDDGALWLVGPDAETPPAGVTVIRTARLAQMIAPTITPAPPADFTWRVLEEADGAAMRDLALLTRPGPFHPLTHRLGRFVGVHDMDGRLIAMAGERMRMPGFAEVSGVCTHPDARGRGYAGALMRIVMQAMLDRGETPFLHAYASHDRTIALYETLGFRVRALLPMMVISRSR
ncbi:GNAT family N-acetyltransferase [Sphingobium yanoikuyae]|uniref:GNAT family N-acetyltransferase n=1 Tax=Sphingobium yanoikuyae TaxID=13690 RepID=A0A9X7UEH3_SPHYA|nr:GNAT family N-acetyltransferase [Sphingobium yanoikuyae]QNG48841.1 GNAT family N-acetyltransferase [Sphingobium yanoikuyae]